jgi:hypothetical protein
MKDVSFRLNDNIELETYKTYLFKSSNPVIGINRVFIVVESDPFSYTRHMIKYERKKMVMNGSVFDRIIVLENNS